MPIRRITVEFADQLYAGQAFNFLTITGNMNQLHRTDLDNVPPRYQPGTVVYTRGEPGVKLAVLSYVGGIYYCAVIGNAQQNNLPFLECQLEAGRSV